MSKIDIKKVVPNGKYRSGKYTPKNPQKYIGDIDNIIYRSSWELRFSTYCDINPNVLKWSSEPVQIPYWSPVDKKEHTYNPDYYVKTKKLDGKEEQWIIEIKPANQYKKDKKPVFEGKVTEKRVNSYNKRMEEWIINRAKYDAAMRYAKANGYRFGVVDETFVFR